MDMFNEINLFAFQIEIWTVVFSSGNCTSGSRSYSDLVDTWADCLHPPARLVWTLPCTMAHSK